jgi:hypothetical protein
MTEHQFYGEEVELLRAVADAARSLRDSNRVGLFNLVLRDERRLDLALEALDAQGVNRTPAPWRGGEGA